VFEIIGADGDINNITFSGVTYYAPEGDDTGNTLFLASWGEWLYVSDNVTSTLRVYSISDHFTRFEQISTVTAPFVYQYSETQIIELPGEVLWMVNRIPYTNLGGIDRWISTDRGRTWSQHQTNLPAPFTGPASRFTLMTLASGNILFVNHYNTTLRENLAAFLSEDNGETWPYMIMLDYRMWPSYPQAVQYPDGRIFIVHDKGRTAEGEIRLDILTEEDIKFGDFISEGSRHGMVISQIKKAKDLVKVDEIFPRSIKINVGTAKKEVDALLPKTVNVTDDKGVKTKITGEWNLSVLNVNKKGVYYLQFSPNKIPVGTVDVLGILLVKVEVADNAFIIKSRSGDFENVVSVDAGTPFGTISKDWPTEITVTDEFGREFDLTGTWNGAKFKPGQSGKQKISFAATNMPVYLEDKNGLLTITVTVGAGGGDDDDDDSPIIVGGCGSIAVSGGSGGIIIPLLCGAVLYLTVTAAAKRKKEKKAA
jgi:hypothetical protein